MENVGLTDEYIMEIRVKKALEVSKASMVSSETAQARIEEALQFPANR